MRIRDKITIFTLILLTKIPEGQIQLMPIKNLMDQYEELLSKGRLLYPDLDNSIAKANEVASQLELLQEFVEMTNRARIKF